MRRTAQSLIIAALAATVGLAFPGIGSATQGDPETDDQRATALPGNVVSEPGGRDDCPQIWPGSHGVQVESEDDGTYLDITGVADGIEVVGVIVKGSNAYNKYDRDKLGDLPWKDLRSPLAGNSGKPAEISHWFACGVQDEPTTTTRPPSTTDSPAPTTTSGQTTPATETTLTTPATPTSAVPTSVGETSAPVGEVSPVAGSEELADTGADTGWAVLLGLFLLLGGAVVLVSPKVRAALGRR